MMKFIFSFLFLSASSTVFSSVSLFWLSGVGLILLMCVFSMENLSSLASSFMGYGASLDSLSYSLIFLSFWVSLLMYPASYKILVQGDSPKYFSFLVLVLAFTLLLTFSSTNYLMFYFMFEASLIPTLLIIMGWGYQPERLQAGVYFLFYTLSVSLPLLLAIMWFSKTSLSLEYFLPVSLDQTKLVSTLICLTLSGAFLVKLPMFMEHLWLPSAHVEAPVAGSMILAGVLLKLGGYGLFRVLALCGAGLNLVSSFLIGVSLFGMFYVGLMCCRLNDFKALVAYSSVAHMALVISGVYSYYAWGYNGSLMMMVSHGLSSSGLFCIVNMYYERLGSRSFFINSGLILILPIFSMLMFFLCAANISAPPTINLLSEIFLMGSIMSFDQGMMLVFPIGSFLGAVFTIFMFSYSQHGKIFFTGFSFPLINFREVHTLVIHVVPVNFLILKPDYFLVSLC